MPLAHLAKQARAWKAPILVVALSALIALLITVVTRPDVPAEPAPAGSDRISLLQDEHALLADYARGQREAEHAAADRSRAEMLRSTVAAAVPALAVPAETVPVPRPVRAVRMASAEAVQKEAPAVAGPPLQLQASAPGREPPRRQGGAVVERARAALATVERIPHWVGAGMRDAANWAILGPVQTIVRIPERRFL